MADVGFVMLIGLYFILACQVGIWQTIRRLGFASATPAMYLKHTDVYHLVCWFPFCTAIACVFWTTVIPVSIASVALIMAWLISGIIARKKGLATYRSILQMLLEDESDETTQAEIRERLERSDAELLNAALPA